MKNSGGLVLDSTANANHGTIYGATEVDGLLGRCLSFDGVDDVVVIPDDASLHLSSALTVELFSKIGAPSSSYQVIVDLQAGAMVFTDVPRMALRLTAPTDREVNISNAARAPGNGPYHHAFTAGGGDMAAYFSGSVVETQTYTPPIPTDTTDLGIGAYVGGNNAALMIPSFVAISSVARSPAWIALTNASLKDELIAFSTPGTESLTGNERMRLTSDGKLIANEFVEV
jgi:hypothetical protein